MQTTTTKAIISRDKLMEYIHEDRDLLMGLQDDLSDMLSATGRYSITLDEVVQNYMLGDTSNDPDLPTEVDAIFEELEGTIDRHYDKIEKAQAKQPTMEW